MSVQPPNGPAGPVSPGDSRPPSPLSRLQETHDRLQATLEALPDLLFVLDRDGRIYDYHAPVQDRLFLPPDQFLGRRMKEVLPEPAAGIINWAIEDAVAHGFHRGSVYPLPTPSGDHWFELSIAAQGDPQQPHGRLVAIVRDITARRAAEEKLRESEAQFRMLTEGMKDVAWVFDVEGRRFTYVSPSVEALRGYTPEEILARPFEEALVPEQRGAIAALLEQSVARFLGGEADENNFFTLQILQPCKDGATVPSEAVCRLVRNRSNGRLEVQGITRDMSARVRAEDAVRQSEQRLRQIIDLVPHFIFAKDAEGRFILANQAIADAYGTTVDGMLGKTDAHFDSSQDEVRHFREDDLAVLASGRPLVVPEETITDAQGRQRTLATTKIPFTSLAPPAPAVLGVAVDITGLRRTEAALLEREQRFKEIAEQSRMIVWEVDTSGLYTYVNEVCFDLVGYRPEEIVGKLHFYDLHPEEGREAIKAAAFQTIQSQLRFENFENPVQARDGSILWVSTTAEPLFDADGHLRGYRGSDLDITERKRAEDALRLFKESVENASDAVGMSTPEGRHHFQNRAFDELFGPVGENPPETLYVDPAVGHEVFRTIIAGGQWTGEVQMYARDRRILDILLRAYATKDENGRVTALLGIHTDITERKRAEDALRESRDQMARTQEMAHLGSWELDLAKDELAWSDEVYRIFGLAPQEFAGTYDAFLDHVHPEDRAAVDAAYWTSVRDGSAAYELDHRIVREGTREIRWVHEKCTHVRDAQGKTLRSTGMVLDITERKLAEDKLRESEARGRALTDNLPGGLVFQVDAGVNGDQHRFVFISKGVETLHEVTAEAVLKDESVLYRQVFEEDLPLFAAGEAKALADMSYFTVEVRCRLPSGSVRWIHISSSPRRLDNGHLIWDGIELDITERKQAEEALRESELRLRALNDNLPGGLVYQVDTGVDGREFRLLSISKGVEQLHGVTVEEALRKHNVFFLQLVEEDQAWVAELTARAIATLTTFRAEVRCRMPTGEIKWIYVSSAPRRLPNGHVLWDGIELDITERKQAEEALRESEARRRAIHGNMPDGLVYQIDSGENGSERRFSFISQGVERLHGVGVDAALADSSCIYGQILEEDRPLLAALEARAAETLTPLRADVRVRLPSGEVRWRHFTSAPRRLDNGHLIWDGIELDITDRKHAEEALRENEERFEQSSKQSRTYLWEVDPTGLFTFVNPVVEDVLGYRPEELVGRRYFYDLMPEDRRESFKTEILEAIQQRLSFRDYENPCQSKDGRVVWVITAAIPMRNADGTLKGYRGSDTDITARKQAEEDLRLSEQTYRMLTETMKDVVWVLDVEAQRFLYVSPSVTALRGFTPEEILARPLVESWAPEEREALMQRMQFHVGEFLAGRIGEDFYLTLEMRQPCKDGSTTSSEVVCHLVRNRNTGRLELHGVSRDVTERKQAEKALRQSEAKYRLLHESMRDAFVSVDMGGHILEANAAFQTLTGYDEDELRRLTYQDLTPGKWHAHEARIVAEQVMTRGYSDVYQKEYRHKDGTAIPIEIRTILIRDDAGHPAGMWATVRNITARLRVERALKQATGELERRVKERTADLEASRQALARSEEQFRQMTEIIQEVFWLVDAKSGAALYVSPAFEDIWGRPPRKDNPGVDSWVASLHPDDQAHALQTFHQGLEVGNFDPLEVRVVRPDGALRWIEVRGWLLHSTAGNSPRVAGVMRDITDRRRLETDILNAAELERQRIGRDLHDSLGQALTGIGYLAEALREELARETRPEAVEAGKLAHLVVDAADRAHAMARGLLLADMKRGGLAPALQELAFRTQELFGVECRYEGLAEVDLTDLEVAGHVYRIAQEAATNSAKHGKGTGILIRFDQIPEGLQLSIQDNGPGMPEAPGTERRMGLDIMRYRAGLIGGTFWIDSRPGQGTTVNCVIPRSRLHPENSP
jgi:PAS domain S-box-containing protein